MVMRTARLMTGLPASRQTRYAHHGKCSKCGARQAMPCLALSGQHGGPPRNRYSSFPHTGRPQVAWLADGRVQCEVCGRFVKASQHSCKRVRVRPALPAGLYEGKIPTPDIKAA
jgi:hypothetical protein